tara:strand:- start:386 stop:664 length:279 start_codon:yes stop_codon:yes gene_type:complete
MKDYYSALGLPSHATLSDVKKAFRQKASFFHPDRNPDPGAPAEFRHAQEAYEILSDIEQRERYDNNRRRNLLEDPLLTAQEIWTKYMQTVVN